MAIDDNTSYELTGYQVKDLAQKIRAKADSTSLASVATSGLYSDLTGAPTIPTVYNGKLTITVNGTNAGEFTANQSTDTTIALTDTTYSDFVGATSLSDGSEGLVPAPTAGDDTKFLSGDGSWKSAGGEAISIYNATNQTISTPTTTYGAGVVVPLTSATSMFDSSLFELYGGGVRVKKKGMYLVQANFMIDQHQTNGVYAIPQTYKNANAAIAQCYERSYSTSNIWYGGSLAARVISANANDVFYLRAASSAADYTYRFAGQNFTFLTVQRIA